MRTFEFRRHSIKDGPTKDMVGPRGHALARAVGERQLRGRGFTHFFCSDRWRTHQTLAAFCEGAGDMVVKRLPPHAPIYFGVDRDDVRKLFRACEEGERLRKEPILATALKLGPDICNELGLASHDAFLSWNELLPPDAHVLVVGHSPSMELLAMTGGNKDVPSLKECQGFRVFVEDTGRKRWRISYDFESPDLHPSAIRAELKLDGPA
jgi:phosphohistidine phosphatase SixA